MYFGIYFSPRHQAREATRLKAEEEERKKQEEEEERKRLEEEEQAKKLKKGGRAAPAKKKVCVCGCVVEVRSQERLNTVG